MWYDLIEQELILEPKDIIRGSTRHPKEIFTKWSRQQLNVLHIYPVVEKTRPDENYYTLSNFTYHTVTNGYSYENFTATEKPLDEIKTAKKAEINGLRDAKLAEGFKYQNHVYDTDDESISNLMGMVLASAIGIPLPEGFKWRDAENKDVYLNYTGLTELARSLIYWRNAIYQASWDDKADIDKLNNINNVKDFTSRIVLTDWAALGFTIKKNGKIQIT